MTTTTDSVKMYLDALQALYHHPDSNVRKEAGKWLQKFQISVEAWQICDSLLHDANSNLEVQYFSALTLKTKIQRDYEELPAGASDSLRSSLLNLLSKFRLGPPAVRTQLCLAVVALAAHSEPVFWGNEDGIVYWIQSQLQSQQRNQQIDFIPAFLELLTILPQESGSYKLAVKPERRRNFISELSVNVINVFNLLASFLSIYPQLKKEILETFTAWMRIAVGIPCSTLVSHPLTILALDGLHFIDTFDSSVDAVSELIKYSVYPNNEKMKENLPLIEFIVSKVMLLLPKFEKALEAARAELEGRHIDCDEDEDTIKSIARLFAEIGENYITIILTGTDFSFRFVSAMIEITSHPDFPICSTTFNFWHYLSAILGGRYPEDNDDAFTLEATSIIEKEKRLLFFKPFFEKLVSLVCFRIKHPLNYESLRSDEKAEFKQIRISVAEKINDSAFVLGGDRVLHLLSEPFFKVIDDSSKGSEFDWTTAESCLYCIRNVANLVSKDEMIVLPNIMNVLPNLPKQPMLIYTACLTIGAYSPWMSQSTVVNDLLQKILNFLFLSLTLSSEVSSASALTIKHISVDCKQYMVPMLNEFLQVYYEIIFKNENIKIDSEDELQIVEALSTVISVAGAGAHEALKSLASPIVENIKNFTSSPSFTNNQIIIQIDRLTNIFRYVLLPQELSVLFQEMFYLFQCIFELKGDDSYVIEKLSRTIKYAIRNCRDYLFSSIPNLLNEIKRRFIQNKQSPLLYVTSEIVKVFKKYSELHSVLCETIYFLFEETANILKSNKEFSLYSELADDCFLLASRCMRYSPNLILNLTNFAKIFDCAVLGITLQHREANKSILGFLKDVLEMPLSEDGFQYKPVLEMCIARRGLTLTRILIAAIAGAIPDSRLEDVADVLGALVSLCGMEAVKWVSESMAMVPVAAVTEKEKESLVRTMADLATGAEGSSSLIMAVEELSGVCRRNGRVIDSVQDALHPFQLD